MNTLGGGELWSGKNNLVGPVSPFKCYLSRDRSSSDELEISNGAVDETRTRNNMLGRHVHYRLCYDDGNKERSPAGLGRGSILILLDLNNSKITVDDLQFINQAGAGVDQFESFRILNIGFSVSIILNAHPCARVVQNCSIGTIGAD